MKTLYLALIGFSMLSQCATPATSVAIADDKSAELVRFGVPVQQATLISIDQDCECAFSPENPNLNKTNLNVRMDQLVSWGAWRDFCRQPQIFLTDGSVIVGDIISAEQQALAIRSDLIGRSEVAFEHIAAINLEPKRDDFRRDQQSDQLLTIRSASSENGKTPRPNKSTPVVVAVLSSGDRVKGKLLTIDTEQRHRIRRVKFNNDSGLISLQFSRIRAIQWRTIRNDYDAKCVIGLSNGSLLFVQKVRPTEQGYRLQLAGGATINVNVSGQTLSEHVVFLQSFTSGARYLSDEEPLNQRQVPMLTAGFSSHSDRAATGTKLRCKGKVFLKGIGMHANASFAYSLQPSDRLFAADVAVDQSAGNHGSVVFRVFLLDDENRWKGVYESEVVRGNQTPLSIRIKLPRRHSAIALAVDSAADGGVMDRANWLNARLE